MRLTKKRADNGRCYLSGLAEVLNGYPKGYGWIQVGHAVDKLAEYEDLEEQNRLLKLPCAVGDELYLLLERNAGGFGIVKSKLVKYSISEKCEIFSAFYECKEIGNTIEFYRCDFGETVFLTKEAAEAAEAALKEMSE